MTGFALNYNSLGIYYCVLVYVCIIFFCFDVSEHMFFTVTVSCRVRIYVCTYVRVYNFFFALA